MPAVPFALSIHHFISTVGGDAGFASLIGLALLALLYFSHARETASVREHAEELEDRVYELEERLAGLGQPAAPASGAIQAMRAAQPASVAAGGGAPGVAAAPGAGAAGATPRRVSTAPSELTMALAPAAPAGTGGPSLAAATRVIPLALAGGAASAGAARAASGGQPASPGGPPAYSGGVASPGGPPAYSGGAASPGGPPAYSGGAASPGGSPASPAGPAQPSIPRPATAAGGVNGSGGTAPAPAQPAPTAAPPAQRQAPAGVRSQPGSAPPPAPAPGAPVPASAPGPRQVSGAGAVRAAAARPPSRTAGSRARSRNGSFSGPPAPRPLRVLLPLAAVLLVGAVVVALVLASSGGNGHHNPTAAVRTTPPASNAPTTATPAVPADVTVAVLNGTAVSGLAHRVELELASAGYRGGKVATATDQTRTATVVAFLPGHRMEALAVARTLKLGSASVQPVDPATQLVACPPSTTCAADVVVTVGTDLAATS